MKVLLQQKIFYLIQLPKGCICISLNRRFPPAAEFPGFLINPYQPLFVGNGVDNRNRI